MTPKGISVTNVSGITRYSSVDLVSYTAFGFRNNFHCDLKVLWTSPHMGTKPLQRSKLSVKKYKPGLKPHCSGGHSSRWLKPPRACDVRYPKDITKPLATACSPSCCLASFRTYTRLQEEYSVASFLGLWALLILCTLPCFFVCLYKATTAFMLSIPVL